MNSVGCGETLAKPGSCGQKRRLASAKRPASTRVSIRGARRRRLGSGLTVVLRFQRVCEIAEDDVAAEIVVRPLPLLRAQPAHPRLQLRQLPPPRRQRTHALEV